MLGLIWGCWKLFPLTEAFCLTAGSLQNLGKPLVGRLEMASEDTPLAPPAPPSHHMAMLFQ